MKRRRDLLHQSAELRFPDDEAMQRWYIDEHRRRSAAWTDTHYEIGREAFEELVAEMTERFGPRPPIMPARKPAPEGEPEAVPAAKPVDPFSHGPGGLLHTLIEKLTGETPSPNCSCRARAKRMNAWGWWGCWKHRRTIIGWLVEEAGKRGHTVDRESVAGLLRAGLREAWRGDRKSRAHA